MSSLIKRIVNINKAEDEFDKRNSDYSLAAFKQKPKTLTRESEKLNRENYLIKLLNQVLMRIKNFNEQNKFHMMLLTDNDNKNVSNQKE